LKTPINLLTELANTEEGTEKLIEINAIPNLISLFEKENISIKWKKSALWILGKICSKSCGQLLNDKYKILDQIIFFFSTCEDFAMKGTICYVLCYIAQNKELRHAIETLGWQFFFNSDICFPSNMDSLYLNTGERYENKKFFDDLDKINKYIQLNDKSQEIYNHIANLLNTITYKQSYEKLNEILKNDTKAFNDPNLIIKIYSMLSTYKYRQPLRRFILTLFENAMSSIDILEKTRQIMEKFSDDLF
jgi:rapamycin-insensitive companion of mTOR